MFSFVRPLIHPGVQRFTPAMAPGVAELHPAPSRTQQPRHDATVQNLPGLNRAEMSPTPAGSSGKPLLQEYMFLGCSVAHANAMLATSILGSNTIDVCNVFILPSTINHLRSHVV